MNFLIFLLAFIFCLFSVIGYGYIFNNIFLKKYKIENHLIYNGFYGLALISLISLITSIFMPHNYFHNIILHLIGLTSFFFLDKFNFKYIKGILFISLLVFLLLLISKTNEDFPYYHLPFVNYLVEQKIIFGMGNINHGYNYISSFLFLSSTFYLPFIDIYSFHFSAIFFLIFFNYLLLVELFEKKNHPIINFLYLFCFTFFNVSFNRIAEFGTDKAGQLLIVVIIIKLLKFLCFEKKTIKLKKIIFLLPLLGLCITLKTYFVPYVLLGLVVIFVNHKPFINLIYLISSKSFVFFITIISVSFFHHFVSTGCLISPVPFTCFGDIFTWARDINHVTNLSNWLEQWSKAGAGPDHRVSDPLLYIKDFNWVPTWFEKYFVVKMLDQIAIFFVSFIILILIFKKFKLNKNIKNFNEWNFWLIYLVVIFIFFIWFNKHPALRYGGYPVFFLVISMPFSYLISKLENTDYFYLRLKYFVLFIFLIVNLKNSLRIYDEFNRNDKFKFSSFRFYTIDQQKYKKTKFLDNFHIYSPHGSYCWKIPSPCGNPENIYVTKKNGYFFINKIRSN